MTRNMRGDRASVRVARMVGSSVRRKPIPWRTAIPRSGAGRGVLFFSLRSPLAAIRDRCRFWALFGRDRGVGECLLLREERKSGLRGPISVFGPTADHYPPVTFLL